MKVQIYSREAIEELLKDNTLDNVAVISFCDPPSPKTSETIKPVDYRGKAERVITIPIHDIDIEILEDYGLTFDTYFPEVDSLAEYICQAINDGLDIICHANTDRVVVLPVPPPFWSTTTKTAYRYLLIIDIIPINLSTTS